MSRHASIPGSEVSMRRLFVAAAIGIVLIAGGRAQAPVARLLTPGDTLALRDLGEIAIAPDGSAILFTVSRSNLAANRTDVDLLLLKPGDAAPLKLTTTASGVN